VLAIIRSRQSVLMLVFDTILIRIYFKKILKLYCLSVSYNQIFVLGSFSPDSYRDGLESLTEH